MFILQKIDNKEAYKLYYEFIKSANPEWKKTYEMECVFLKQTKLEQNEMSDYEYFLKTRVDLNNKYLLLWQNKPVCLIMISERNDTTKDISFSTVPVYQRKGFATQAVKMVEEMLFQKDNVLFTSIVDMNPKHISGKIAENLDYKYLEDGGFYLKVNPNLELDEIERRLKLSTDKRLT